MNTIYFVRHGETEWNKIGKYQGFSDIPLSDLGIRQAEACAKAMEDISIDYIITSDLCRAQTTAEAINKKQANPVTIKIDSRLREINFGCWETLTYDEIETKWPGAIREMYLKPADIRIEGGESFRDVQERSWEALKDCLEQVEEGATILVVCHGGTIRTLLCKLLHMDLNHAWNFSQGNTAISRINYFGMEETDHNLLSLLNDVSHTKGL